MSHINELLATITLPEGMTFHRYDNTRVFEAFEEGYIVYLLHEHRKFGFEIPRDANDNRIIQLAEQAVIEFTNFINNGFCD